ncbi:MAG: GatB/YqeY domain-containing protein [Spirochaetia bacterium]|nr:GatB/YqeY domain-containing protein [Spirochaetia bacterium]
MSKLFSKIEEDLKTALKKKSEVELSTLRLLKSDIQYETTKSGSKELTDESIQSIIKKAVKKRNESIEQFKKAGRNDLSDKEQIEINILNRYLPEEISENQIIPVIDEILKKSDASPHAGKITGMVMSKFKGQNINGSLVKDLVQARIQN